MEYLYILIGGVLWNNLLVTHLLGLYPFLGERPSTDLQNLGMGLTTTAVVLVTAAAGFLIRTSVLVPWDLLYLEHLVLVVVLLLALLAVRGITGKSGSPMPDHLAMRILLNSAALGAVVLTLGSGPSGVSLTEKLISAVGLGFGITFLLVLVQAIENRPETRLMPPWLRGVPFQLITFGMIALALQGFAGIG